MEDQLNTDIENLKAPVTTYGIYVAIMTAAMVLTLLCLLKLDHKSIAELLLHYYLK
ncbi:MAG: hypothetical protein NVSMB24_32680 [Mucilaginibacter sp.]